MFNPYTCGSAKGKQQMSVQRIYTDGACSGNPGPGGWAVLFLLPNELKVFSGHEHVTTNNRMELYAVIRALQLCKANITIRDYKRIEIHSDSAYVVNAITKSWLKKWKNNSWKTGAGDEVKNIDLWTIVDNLLSALKPKIVFVKVKGHSGDKFNDIVDKEATTLRDKARTELTETKG